jgi:putative oxidoreductase
MEGQEMDWKRLVQFALLGSSDLEQYAILLVRVSLGLFFAISGANKLFVAGGTKPVYETLVKAKVPFPHLTAYFVSGVEFVAGSLFDRGASFEPGLRGFIGRYDCRRPDQRAFHHA